MYGIGRLAARAFDFKTAHAIGEQFVAAGATDFHAVSFIPVKSTALDRAAASGLQDSLRAGVAVFLASRRRRLLFCLPPHYAHNNGDNSAHRGDSAATLRRAPRVVSTSDSTLRICGNLLSPSFFSGHRCISARAKSAIHQI